jgi:hypothetical protein
VGGILVGGFNGGSSPTEKLVSAKISALFLIGHCSGASSAAFSVLVLIGAHCGVCFAVDSGQLVGWSLR